uniref:MADF domain-containing protein n=1 Tax=Anopheles epiroticus TaxID=199890 RepID=A0A182PIE0_9DIPT
MEEEEEASVAVASVPVTDTSTAALLLLGGHNTAHHHLLPQHLHRQHHHRHHGQPHDFKWTHERCLLLLHEYDLLKDKFKDRKHKKKDLWAEISMKFKKIYAYDLEWDVAYKKFRNLKQTFEQVRAKMQQQAITGQISNRPKWAYFEKFQQILDDPGIPAHGYVDPPPPAHLHQHQQPHHHHHKHDHHINAHHHTEHAGQHVVAAHAHLSATASVGQEDFTDTLMSVFPMGEELEIPTQPAVEETVGEAKLEQEEHIQEERVEADEEDEELQELQGEQLVEEHEEEEELVEDQVDETEEAPHRKRFRRLSTYEQERLLIEREKLDTLREIQRGIECKNDILRGILHVLQSRVWQAHAGNG